MMRNVRKICRLFLVAIALFPQSALARKSNQAVYQDPYDLAAGGASLTRASRAGRLFANPALLPYGGVFSLWFGSTTSVFVNDGFCVLAGAACPLPSASPSQSDEEIDAAAAESGADPDVLKLAFSKPFRLGLAQNFAWVTSHMGFSLFSRNEIDLDAKKVGDSGTPTVDFAMESYTGLQLGFAMRSPVRWFSLGGALKAIVASEPELNLGLDVLDRLQGDNSQAFFQSQLADNFEPKLGYGFDIGTLFFFQGKWADLSLGATVDDVGNTKFNPAPGLSGLFGEPSGTTADDEETAETSETTYTLTEFKQVMSAGAGFTLHTAVDQIHLSVDYRDIQNAYEEPLFKRVYGGAKITLRQYIGVATGIYHGYPSAGIEVDLILAQLSLTTYAREMSDKPGLNPRRYFVLSFSAGG